MRQKSTQQVADQLQVDDSHIRRLAIKHGIGELVSPRIRVFSTDDVAALQAKLKGGKMGRPRRQAVQVAS